MGYFNTLTSSLFKQDVSGKTVFYPWGVLGKGHVLPDDETENRIRGFVRRYYIISLTLIIIMGAALGWIYVFALVPVLTIWYYFKSKVLTAGCSVTDDKLTLKESYANEAKSFNKWMLWLFLIFNFLCMGGGLFLLIQGTSNYGKIMGALAFLFCGILAVFYGYMIKVKRN